MAFSGCHVLRWLPSQHSSPPAPGHWVIQEEATVPPFLVSRDQGHT